MSKAYIGDGVYVEMVPEGFVLTTEDGVTTTNRIVLEMDTLHNLQRWIETKLAFYTEKGTRQ